MQPAMLEFAMIGTQREAVSSRAHGVRSAMDSINAGKGPDFLIGVMMISAAEVSENTRRITALTAASLCACRSAPCSACPREARRPAQRVALGFDTRVAKAAAAPLSGTLETSWRAGMAREE